MMRCQSPRATFGASPVLRRAPAVRSGARAVRSTPRRAIADAGALAEAANATVTSLADDTYTRFAFMFPTAVMIATVAQSAGIGGAAIFSPLFVLGFPAFGVPFPGGPATAFASALVTETFGFASGSAGYLRRGLVDLSAVRKFVVVGAPLAAIGGVASATADPALLRGCYGLTMVLLGAFLASDAPLGSPPEPASASSPTSTSLVTADGREFYYTAPVVDFAGGSLTALGGVLTGLLSVGIGEVCLPQLTRRFGMPLPVAAGTSVVTVVLVAACAVVAQVWALAGDSNDLASAVPLELLMYTVPGVIIGGQLAPRVAGILSKERAERFLSAFFLTVGILFLLESQA